MANESHTSPTETGPLPNRRSVLCGTAGTVIAALAGCLGSDPIDEMDSSFEHASTHLDTSKQMFETIVGRMDDDEWDSCLPELEDATAELDAARAEASNALEIARDEEEMELVASLEVMTELVDVLGEMFDVMELVCEAAIEGDEDEMQAQIDALNVIDRNRLAVQEDFERAVDALE